MNARLPTAAGTVGILSVGSGDTTLSFDPANPAERIRAARIVKDMLRRGYALLVAVGKHENGQTKYARALDFNEEVCEYVIADFDPEIAAASDAAEVKNGNQPVEVEPRPAPADGAQPTPKRTYRKRGVAAGEASAVAIGRVAGG